MAYKKNALISIFVLCRWRVMLVLPRLHRNLTVGEKQQELLIVSEETRAGTVLLGLFYELSAYFSSCIRSKRKMLANACNSRLSLTSKRAPIIDEEKAWLNVVAVRWRRQRTTRPSWERK